MKNQRIRYPRILLWGIFAYLIITNNVLSMMGCAALMGTNPIFKLGLGQVLLLVAFFAYFKFLKIDNGEKCMFTVIGIMLFVNMVIKGEYQITNYVSAIIFPVCLSCLLGTYRDDERVRSKIQKMILFFFYIECGMAVIERILKVHFLGEIGDDAISFMESYEFRSQALWGHPLSNSSLMTYLLVFILQNDEFFVKKKNILWGIGMLALLCFNSRLSIVCSAVLYVLINYRELFHSKHKKSILFFMCLLVAGFFYALFYTPLGGRLLNMGLYGDDSSSLARTQIFDIFHGLDLKKFMFIGVPYAQIEVIQRMAGLGYLIIENPWIIFIFRYGIIQTIAMIVFFVPLFRKWLLPYGVKNALIVSAFFVAIISSSNSLAIGSTSIAQLFLFAYAFKKHTK